MVTDVVDPTQRYPEGARPDLGPIPTGDVDPRPGRLLAGRYRLHERLGRGGAGQVWEATDERLDRRVAVKLLAPGTAAALAEHEARTAAAIDHPNVVRVHDVATDGDLPFLVMDLVPGRSLRERLDADGPLGAAAAATMAAAVLDGLAAVHAAGALHRDVKPSNVIETPEGSVRLVDFGVARSPSVGQTITPAGGVVGTPAYLAPEQAVGGDVDERTDVFAAGVLLHELAVGRPIAAGGRPDPALPGALAAVVETAVAADPAARHPDVTTMRGALRRALGEHDTLAVAAVSGAAAPGRRAPRALLVVLALVAGVLAAAWIGSTLDGGDPALADDPAPIADGEVPGDDEIDAALADLAGDLTPDPAAAGSRGPELLDALVALGNAPRETRPALAADLAASVAAWHEAGELDGAVARRVTDIARALADQQAAATPTTAPPTTTTAAPTTAPPEPDPQPAPKKQRRRGGDDD